MFFLFPNSTPQIPYQYPCRLHPPFRYCSYPSWPSIFTRFSGNWDFFSVRDYRANILTTAAHRYPMFRLCRIMIDIPRSTMCLQVLEIQIHRIRWIHISPESGVLTTDLQRHLQKFHPDLAHDSLASITKVNLHVISGISVVSAG